MNYIETCAAKGGAQKNTGASGQSLEEGIKAYILAKEDFFFASLIDFKSKAKWDEAKAAKNIVVMYQIDEIEPDNSDAEFQETIRRKDRIKSAVKGINATHILGLQSHRALLSYEDSAYTRVYKILDDGKVTGFHDETGKIYGEKLSGFTVGIRQDAIIGVQTPKTVVNLKFNNYREFEKNPVIATPDFAIDNYNGIFDVNLEADAVAGNAVSVAATLGGGCDPVKSLVLANWVLTDAAGGAKAITSATYNAATGKYDFVGVSIIATDILTLNGVVEQSVNMYESTGAIVLT